MANQEREPFVLDFPNGQRVEDILKKADQLPTKAQLDQEMSSKATMSDVQRETQNLQNQINEIVRAPESGGDVGAEVYQARVGADSTVYPTLKARLDTEENRSSSFIEQIGAFSVSFSISAGSEHSSQHDRIYIPVQSGDVLSILVSTDMGLYNATIFGYPTDATTDGVIIGTAEINSSTDVSVAADYQYIGVFLDDVTYDRDVTMTVWRKPSSTYQVAVDTIKEYFTYQPEFSLEIGNIYITANPPVYGDSNKRVRLSENTRILLQPGDKIGLSDYTDAEFFLGWLRSDNTWGYKNGWNRSDVLIEELGEYFFVLRNRVEAVQSDTQALGDLLFIKHTAKPTEYVNEAQVQAVAAEVAQEESYHINNSNLLTMIMPSGNHVQYNSSTEILTIPRDCIIISPRYEASYKVITTACELDLSEVGSTALKILYDFDTDTFSAQRYSIAHADTQGLVAVIRKLYQGTGTVEITATFPYSIDERIYGLDSFEMYQNSNVRSINHRGYNTVAPENTLPAFILSKKMGFNYVETDVAFTADSVPVLLHDATVDRTSDGTGNISDLTLQEVKALDFGSWKSPIYAGTRIPTLEEFISLCRNIGLHPYLELKSGNSDTQIQNCCDIVRRHGMRNNVTWISYSSTLLGYVKTYEPDARLGLLADTVSEATITTALSLRTDNNEVFIDGSTVPDAIITSMINAGLPLETWVGNSEAAILAKPDYNTGFTTDKFHAGMVLLKAYGN